MSTVTELNESTKSVTPDFFPLRLSDFEYYMLTDDRPSHPMVFVMVVHVSGTISEAPLRASLRELIASHPLHGCRIQQLPGKGWCWVPVRLSEERVSKILHWETVAEVTAREFVPPVVSIDIRNEPGIRVDVFAADHWAQVVVYLHHACCDGIGALQLIGELFARYGQKTAPPEAKRPDFELPNPALLLERENYTTGDSSTQRQKKSLTTIIGKISRLLFRAPVILASSAELSSGDPARKVHANRSLNPFDQSAIRSHLLPKSLHRTLRAVANHLQVSLNDLLVREMTLHIRDWNRRAGLSFGRRWIRLAIPLSMRTSRHDNMSAANVVSYALVTRREADCEDPDELLKSIHQQTSNVLFNREGIVCLKLFRLLRKIPGAMKLFLNYKTVLSTAVMANVGDVRRRFRGRFPLQKGRWIAGNVVVEQIHGVAPVRPNTLAAMSIGDYAGELSISLRTDGVMLNAEDSHQFLTEFLQRLNTLAEHSNFPDTEALEPDVPIE
jgi:NRPS condensation-like uncharacterized protein